MDFLCADENSPISLGGIFIGSVEDSRMGFMAKNVPKRIFRFTRFARGNCGEDFVFWGGFVFEEGDGGSSVTGEKYFCLRWRFMGIV